MRKTLVALAAAGSSHAMSGAGGPAGLSAFNDYDALRGGDSTAAETELNFEFEDLLSCAPASRMSQTHQRRGRGGPFRRAVKPTVERTRGRSNVDNLEKSRKI